MKQTIKLGDTVTGSYYGVAYTGTVRSYDGSGYIYIVPTTPIVVYGVARDEIAVSPGSEERDSLKVVASPETLPAVRVYSNAAMGGASLV